MFDLRLALRDKEISNTTRPSDDIGSGRNIRARISNIGGNRGNIPNRHDFAFADNLRFDEAAVE
jgi:hypothetical protein